MTKQEYADYEKSVAAFIERENIVHLSTGTVDYNDDSRGQDQDSGEPWFSWHACECCQSHLGGNREYLYARDKETDIFLEYEICEDCVYYINYGRLDDMTMLEIERN